MTEQTGPGGSMCVTNRKKRRIPCPLWGGERAKPTLELARALGLRFRVHVVQIGAPRSRRVEIAATDADAAGVRAFEEIGGGWKVPPVESL